MTITVSSDLTDISSCDLTTSSGTHYRLAGTSSGNPAADADTYVQGSACIANKMGATFGAADVGGHFNSTLTFDITGKHLFHWRFIISAGNMETKAGKGVTIGLTNTSTVSTTAWSSTNYKQWYLDGKDTLPISPGWQCYVLDPTKAADASAGTLTLTTVKNVGYVCRQVSGVTTTLSNQFVDAIRMGTGLTATASSAGDTISFASLYDQDKLTANAWGVITANAGIYYGAAKMTIGSIVQTNTCLFKDTNAVLVWRNFLVADTLYEFNLLGAALFKTTFQLGNKDGSDSTSDGCVVRGQGTAVWNITCEANSGFKAYASSLSRCRAATLSATSELRDTAVSASGTFDVNGATIANCTFSAHTATQLKVDSTAEMSVVTDSAFSSAGTGHAIELTVAGTYSFAGLKFAGYAASNGSTGNEAVYVNVASGSVTVNVSGGGTTPTIRTAGAAVTVNNSIALTLTGLVSGSDIVILDAGTTTERVNVDANSGSTYVYSFSTGGNVDICVYLAGYVPFSIRNLTLPTANASVPVSQVLDRNYTP